MCSPDYLKRAGSERQGKRAPSDDDVLRWMIVNVKWTRRQFLSGEGAIQKKNQPERVDSEATRGAAAKAKKLKDAITKTRKVFFGVVGTRNQREYRTGSQDIIDFVVVATSTTECDSACVDRLATTRLGKAYSQMRCRRSLRRCLGRARCCS